MANAPTQSSIAYAAALTAMFQDAYPGTEYGAEGGLKRDRIFRRAHGQRMVHSFIDRNTTAVHKSLSWKSAVPTPMYRDAEEALQNVGPYSIV